ncbi:MAG TPA: hypothetical protein VMV72_04920 [Verrucomicrobiae bacterium]|nr:hypothetical protein [Verrucomicrobiae bacterium]
MPQSTLTAYAIVSPNYGGYQIQLDHTFVVSDSQDDWRCWGRGHETVNNGARPIASGTALAEWARLIYGSDPSQPTGQPQPERPSGLLQCVEGVCQNAANRLLVLTGGDVSAANGNIFVILVYGKYGYHLQDFVNNVTQSANSINQQQPGAIPQDQLQAVLNRIGDPTAELETLETHFQGALPDTLSDAQNQQLLGVYRSFQTQREAIFEQWWPRNTTMDATSFQKAYTQALIPLFVSSLKQCATILGPDDYNALFKVAPEVAIPLLFNPA